MSLFFTLIKMFKLLSFCFSHPSCYTTVRLKLNIRWNGHYLSQGRKHSRSHTHFPPERHFSILISSVFAWKGSSIPTIHLYMPGIFGLVLCLGVPSSSTTNWVFCLYRGLHLHGLHSFPDLAIHRQRRVAFLPQTSPKSHLLRFCLS